MFSGPGRAMILISMFVGNGFIYAVLGMYDEAFGTIRDKKKKFDAIFFTVVATWFILYSKLLLTEMDIPGIFSMKHEEMEGIVSDYKIVVGQGGENFVTVVDSRTGKTVRFWFVDISSELHIGDSVKMHYLKHNKMGAITKINGKNLEYYIYYFRGHLVETVLSVLLLLSMPFYYFWIYKVKPVINHKLTYTAYTYHDIYIKAMMVLYPFMIQTAIVLIIATKGNYETSWDWYWGLLLTVDYAGVFFLSFLRQKRFVIIKDNFYYCGFKKRAEGALKEIESAEKTGRGVLIRTNKEEMEIRCTSKRYREALLNKLTGKGTVEDGTL